MFTVVWMKIFCNFFSQAKMNKLFFDIKYWWGAINQEILDKHLTSTQ